jgi:hypothetical protein
MVLKEMKLKQKLNIKNDLTLKEKGVYQIFLLKDGKPKTIPRLLANDQYS